MVIVVRAPEKSSYGDRLLSTLGIHSVFLAGCANTEWRKEFLTYFDEKNHILFYDPKRDNWDVNNKEFMEQQIFWEFTNLRKSNVVVFWFNGGSVCPITLLEYGLWGLSKGTPVVIGVSSDYEKKDDIYLQTRLARPDIRIVDNLYELSYELKSKLDEMRKYDKRRG